MKLASGHKKNKHKDTVRTAVPGMYSEVVIHSSTFTVVAIYSPLMNVRIRHNVVQSNSFPLTRHCEFTCACPEGLICRGTAAALRQPVGIPWRPAIYIYIYILYINSNTQRKVSMKCGIVSRTGKTSALRASRPFLDARRTFSFASP